MTAQPAPIKKILEITNLDSKVISLKTNFEKKNLPLNSSKVLISGEKNKLIPIVFTQQVLFWNKFDFNGLYFVDLQVTGQGIQL